MVDREFADGDIAYGHLFESADVEPNAVYVMCMNTFDDEIAEAGRVVLLAFGLVVGFEFDERPVDSVDRDAADSDTLDIASAVEVRFEVEAVADRKSVV